MMTVADLICRRFSFSPAELQAYAQTCPYRYKTYPIDKRNSEQKRWISQPSKDLKAVQRLVLSEFLGPKLTVHASAKAYKADTNIMDNAGPHLKNRYLLKMDFRDFFPSIRALDFIHHLLKNEIVHEETEANLLARIFFKHHDGDLCLSIGSPGSPMISNALLFSFDDNISDKSRRSGIDYTRYSDDLTFSTNKKNLLFSWPTLIKEELTALDSPNLEINSEKTVFSSKKFNRHVTGITITNDGKASVGRDNKRALRSRIYNASTLDEDGLARLRGYISFVNQVESDIVSKLWKKYPDQMGLIFRQK
ncbi:retron St85 family RNA-directed DNA polymerase [Roseibium sp. MB-4]